jgi:presenilin-like A22 family membrane protease
VSDEATPTGARDWPLDELAGHAPQAVIWCCYFATVLGGMLLADEAAAEGLAIFQDPGQVGNVGVFGLYVLVGTLVMLLAFRYGRGEDLVRLFLVAVFGTMTADAVLLAGGAGGHIVSNGALGGIPTSPLGVGLTVGVAAVLWVYPEWYVVDVAAILAGSAAIAMIGLGFGPLPVVVLLVVWAAYDAYAVYGSGHMKDLASGSLDLKVPIVFVVPLEWGASFRDADLEGVVAEAAADAENGDDGETAGEASDEDAERDGPPITLLGLGDAIIPGMLAVSAGQYLDAPVVVTALNANLPALGALVGGVVGLLGIAAISRRFGGVHAGLPPLNAGVLLGYVVGAVAADLSVAAAVGL